MELKRVKRVLNLKKPELWELAKVLDVPVSVASQVKAKLGKTRVLNENSLKSILKEQGLSIRNLKKRATLEFQKNREKIRK